MPRASRPFSTACRAALRKLKIDFGAAGAVRGAGQDHDDGLAFAIGSRGVVEHGLVLVCGSSLLPTSKKTTSGAGAAGAGCASAFAASVGTLRSRAMSPSSAPPPRRRCTRRRGRPVGRAYSWTLSFLEVVITARWLSPDKLSSIAPGRAMRPSFDCGRRTGATPTQAVRSAAQSLRRARRKS